MGCRSNGACPNGIGEIHPGHILISPYATRTFANWIGQSPGVVSFTVNWLYDDAGEERTSCVFFSTLCRLFLALIERGLRQQVDSKIQRRLWSLLTWRSMSRPSEAGVGFFLLGATGIYSPRYLCVDLISFSRRFFKVIQWLCVTTTLRSFVMTLSPWTSGRWMCRSA